MIAGHGIDLVEINRMRRILSKHGERFISRYFDASEIESAMRYRDKGTFYASRFAAKEAFSKAVGTGFVGFAPKDIIVVREDSGPPRFAFSKKLEKKLSAKPEEFFLSISHEKEMAVASVIWRKRG